MGYGVFVEYGRWSKVVTLSASFVGGFLYLWSRPKVVGSADVVGGTRSDWSFRIRQRDREACFIFRLIFKVFKVGTEDALVESSWESMNEGEFLHVPHGLWTQKEFQCCWERCFNGDALFLYRDVLNCKNMYLWKNQNSHLPQIQNFPSAGKAAKGNYINRKWWLVTKITLVWKF